MPITGTMSRKRSHRMVKRCFSVAESSGLLLCVPLELIVALLCVSPQKDTSPILFTLVAERDERTPAHPQPPPQKPWQPTFRWAVAYYGAEEDYYDEDGDTWYEDTHYGEEDYEQNVRTSQARKKLAKPWPNTMMLATTKWMHENG